MNKKEVVTAIVIRSLAIILIITGVLLNIFEEADLLTGAKTLLYFTSHSNILAAIICAIDLVFDIRKLKGKEVVPHQIFNYFKLVVTTGMTLTLIIFWTILAYQMPRSYLYSASNLILHTFGPILILIDYIFFTKDFKVKMPMIIVTWVS